MIDAVAAPYAFEKGVLFMVALRRDQDGYRLADDLFSQVAVDTLCAPVPACDDAIEALTYYCVIAKLDDGSKQRALTRLTIGDVSLPLQFLLKDTDAPHENGRQPNTADGVATVCPTLPLRDNARDRDPMSYDN
jgi:hypothetical protein